MNGIKKILTLTIIGSAIVFAGCEKDDTVKTLEKEEAVQTLEKNSREIESTLEKIETTEGMKAMETLTGLTKKDDPFASTQKSSGDLSIISNLQEILKPVNESHLKRLGDQPFNFDKWVGTYVWLDTKKWDPSYGEPDDKIIIKFPTDTTTEPIENNATLTINEYSEFETTDSLGNTVYVADTVKMNLVVNDEKVVNVNYTLDYNEKQEMVNSLSAVVYIKPFTWELSLTQNSIQAALIHEETGNVVTSISFEVTFMDNMEDVQKLNGHVQLHNLNLEGGIKPYKLQKLEDPAFLSEQEISSLEDMIEYANKQIDVALYQVNTGNKLADLKVVKNEESDAEVPVGVALVFKDGTQEMAKKYFKNVINYIKSVLEKYEVSEPTYSQVK
jgi:hypothetical protein